MIEVAIPKIKEKVDVVSWAPPVDNSWDWFKDWFTTSRALEGVTVLGPRVLQYKKWSKRALDIPVNRTVAKLPSITSNPMKVSGHSSSDTSIPKAYALTTTTCINSERSAAIPLTNKRRSGWWTLGLELELRL